MTSGYHNIRWWRTPDIKWQAVGPNDKHLKPMCAAVSAGLIPALEVKCYNSQVITVRPRTGSVMELMP